jgi:hypothetical protein
VDSKLPTRFEFGASSHGDPIAVPTKANVEHQRKDVVE